MSKRIASKARVTWSERVVRRLGERGISCGYEPTEGVVWVPHVPDSKGQFLGLTDECLALHSIGRDVERPSWVRPGGRVFWEGEEVLESYEGSKAPPVDRVVRDVRVHLKRVGL